jgi:CRP-like cAMP-binding protein
MPDALIAGGLSGLAALSLPIGAVIAILFRPPMRVVAIVMAFGSGALIHAVVTELAVDPAQQMVGLHKYEPFHTWIVLALGFLAGGLAYVGLNAAVEKLGGGLPWKHKLRQRALDRKRAEVSPILEALSRSRIASSLSPQEAEQILPYVSAVDVRAGETVFRRGDPSEALYVVASGRFELRYDDAPPDGSVQGPVTVLEAGATVGGTGLAAGQPRTASLGAREDGVLLMLPRPDLGTLVKKVPCLRGIMADIVTRELYVAARDSGVSDPEEWHRTAVASIEHLTRGEVEAAAEQGAEQSSPLAIFVGALQDGIPESLAIGASFVSLAAFAPTFMVAVFLSNLPEAVAGTSALLRSRFSVLRVVLMWSGLVVGSAVAGTLGYVLLHDASPAYEAFLGAFAGGGVVAMLAMTMMPEAYESGHAGVAPATIVGFLASLLLAVLELGG